MAEDPSQVFVCVSSKSKNSFSFYETMAVPDLPTEVILLIISYLSRPHIVRLLTINRHWYNVTSMQLYQTLCVRSLREQYEYRNLFNETRRRRKQQGPGFYSSENYGLYVRILDLSIPYNGKDITDGVLEDLALDCPNLETLNLYNCHRVTTASVKRVLRACPKVKHLYVSMATNLDARCIQGTNLETLNAFGLPHFFRHRPVALKSLKTLKAGQLLDHQTIQLLESLQHVSLDGIDPFSISELVRHNAQLRSIRLVRCHVDLPLLRHLTQKKLMTLELHRCHIDDDDGLAQIRYEMMQRLELKYMDIASIQQIVDQCSDRLISFLAPYNTSDTVLDTLTKRCPRLTRLSLVTRNGRISLDCLKRTLHAYTSSLVYLELGTNCDRALLQWSNPNLQVLILRTRITLLLLQNLAKLYPSLRVLYIASVEDAAPEDIDQSLFGKLRHLEALMLHDRRDSSNRDYAALKNHYEYWSLRKEIW
ncbi:hypothetical protein BJV82DRAFT_667708 [Fennellomyces sp. T-0311]|nr:hypothetical protein BJV82DRAFT_667708 [Fennellomyces sp. T-0311]